MTSKVGAAQVDECVQQLGGVPAEIDLDELVQVARTVATAAAELIAGAARREPIATKSSSTDVVTAMDQAAQDLLLARLAQARPGDAVFGEERGGRPGDTGITWVVDPIDGTVNYLYQIPMFAVSVAAVLGDPRTDGHWCPVAGVVVNASSAELFSARLGRNSQLEMLGGVHPLRCNQVQELGQVLLATGFGYTAARRAWQGQVLAQLLPQVRDIRRFGSAALDLCQLAQGRVDAYYERGLQPWDYAAGWLIAAQAGAVVAGLSGPPTTGMLLAAAPPTYSPLAAALRAAVNQAEQLVPDR